MTAEATDWSVLDQLCNIRDFLKALSNVSTTELYVPVDPSERYIPQDMTLFLKVKRVNLTGLLPYTLTYSARNYSDFAQMKHLSFEKAWVRGPGHLFEKDTTPRHTDGKVHESEVA